MVLCPPLPWGILKGPTSHISFCGPVHPQKDVVLFLFDATGSCKESTNGLTRAEADEKIRGMWKELQETFGRFRAGRMHGKDVGRSIAGRRASRLT